MTQPAEPVTDPTADPVEIDDEQTDDEHLDDDDSLSDADATETIRKLRDKNAKYRNRAHEAEKLAEERGRALFTAKVSGLGKLADPTDLEYSEELLDDDALSSAVDELLTRRPHYAARKVSGTVGQGITGQQEQSFSMMDRLKQSA